jgi:hypothetical protein
MTAKRYRCIAEGCGKTIDQERTFAALSRGVEPRYCSERCKNAEGQRRLRARRKEGE